ncbi:acyl-CoA reductase [Chitinimonas lacunae]|uniref:long-chain-fatty-acyl-CoA reductase n=1 Tax=Chitinimonas lacunae TaxID=1963018 RepID=A0ABV8MIH0_9NEIS
MYLLQGQLDATLDLDRALARLLPALPAALARPCSADAVLDCAERFADALIAGRLDLGLDPDSQAELASFCRRDTLAAKLERELGETPQSLRRIDYSEAHFEAWRPLGVVLHVTPANAALLPFFAVLESLLVGNINWLRPSSSDNGLSARLLSALLDCDRSGTLADFIAVLPVASHQLDRLFGHVDGVSAWGGDAALESIRRQLPAGCRWIDWGHRISFAYLSPEAASAETLDALADEVCRFDQQACSSPQLLLVDSDDPAVLQALGAQLAEAMARRAPAWPALVPSTQEAAEITTRLGFARLDQTFAAEPGHIWQGQGWRVVWQHRSSVEPSPLFRTVLLRPLPRARLVEALLPWRTHLQSCALACPPGQMAELGRLLLAAGVTRVTPAAEIHQGYAGAPHDGVYALTRLARRVSLTVPAGTLSVHITLDQPPAAPAGLDCPPMDKAAFQDGSLQPGAQLFFRSGGSSGTPKLAGFSYRDYRRQMRAAADGLFAAGLDPARDRVMNLLYAGKLYGGLLSFFTILEQMGAVHYPMGGPSDDDFSEIAQLIVSQRIDTLIGMPSTLHQLFRREEATLRAYGGVRKLMLGGEHLGAPQRRFLESFGISTIRSAIYGSVDAGPLGHACKASPDAVFHLLSDTQWLEIVHPERDEPVAAGESGRLLFTSLAREGQTVRRYEVGDTGRWLDGPCPCGLPSPRFELQGRQGQLLRVGSLFIAPARLAELAGVPVQFVIDHDDSGCERISVLAEGDPAEVRDRLANDADLAEGLRGSLINLHVEPCPSGGFERNSHSGKTPLVIDRRRTAQ